MLTSDVEATLSRAEPPTEAGGPVRDDSPGDLVVIRPRGVFSIDVRELWAYRELVFFLVWRDIKVRYKQTVLGAGWAILQPVMSMVIFSVIFGNFAKIPSDHLPYPLFAYAGILPWTYFSSCLSSSSSSIIGNVNLITKVYLPRLLLPLETIIVPIVDFLLAFVVLAGLMAWYGVAPSWHVIAFPAFLLLALATALGVGLWFSTLNVRYRDIPFMLPFITQIWMYSSPVVYPVSIVPARWQWVLALNPMAGVIEGFRWALLGQSPPSATVLGTSIGMALVLLVSGLAYFRRGEREFADLI